MDPFILGSAPKVTFVRRDMVMPVNNTLHSHTAYEIHYFYGGKCKFIVGNKLYELEPGDLMLMHGMTLHGPHFDPSLPYVRNIIHFDPNYVRNLIPELFTLDLLKPFFRLKNYHISLKGTQRQRVEELMHKLEGLHRNNDNQSKHLFYLGVLELFLVIYDVCETTVDSGPVFSSAKERSVQDMMTYLDQHYKDDVHLADMESYLHMSRFYMAKIFKEVTGNTIFGYLYHLRINHAKVQLLTHKSDTVLNICFKTGFKQPAHFNRVFKSIVGCTPEQYRHGPH